MATFVRITVLMWADILAAYAMWVMMTYLTNVWKLNLTHAAAIINIWGGLPFIMPIGFAFLVDTFMGHYAMLLVSSIAYSIGLGFLAMSTPPVLSKSTGNCSAYQPECIGDVQKILYYTALALIAVGISGHAVSLTSFLNKQTTDQTEDDEWKLPFQCVGIFTVLLVPIIGGIALPCIKPWSIRFGVPAICTVVATLFFSSGSWSYKHDKPQGSPLTTVFRVFVASASKISHKCPQNASELYEKCNLNQRAAPRSGGLRYLKKAAIVLPTPTKEEQEKNRWRLCSVTEVEETKIGIRMVPICMTFLIFGVVISIGKTYFIEQANHMNRKVGHLTVPLPLSVTEVEETKIGIRMVPICMTFLIFGVVISIGKTYFIEQANHMNRKVGHLTVPLPLFLLFYDSAKDLFKKVDFSKACCSGGWGSKRYGPPTGIAVAMVFSVVGCITAAIVETRRHNVIRSHGLLDKPDDKIPMSIFCLLPQFLLLGAVDGISEISIDKFFKDQAPPSMKTYREFFTHVLLGLGIMASVLFGCIVGEVSEKRGKQNWFQETLNKSHLDKYYWTLAVLSSVILVLYILVALCYPYGESAPEDEEATPNEDSAQPPNEDNPQCCCCCG